MELTVILFVYGTLLPEECNHHYLEEAVLMGDDALADAELYDEGTYPMLRPGVGRVYGQCYQVSVAALNAIDELEEHPDFFDRKWVRLASGREAWVYFGPEDYAQQCPKIPGGSWRDRNAAPGR